MKKYRMLTFIFDVPVVAIISYCLIYLFGKTDFTLRGFIISLIFIGVIPLFAWTYLIKHPEDYKGERKMSFIIDIISYPIGFILLIAVKGNRIFSALALSYLLNAVVLLAINKAGYKASGHGAGIAGPATALTISFGAVGAISFLFLIPVFYGKIKLKDHTFQQLLTGSVISILLTYLSFIFMGAV